MAQETLLGFPAHTLYPQGVCGIRKAAEPLTAALPYHRGGFTILSIGSCLFEKCYGRKGTQPSSAILRPMRTPMMEAIIKPRVQPELSPRQ